MEGKGRSLIWSTVLAFSWKVWGKPRKSSLSLVNVPADFEIETLLMQIRVLTAWATVHGVESESR
jgi:hypothetical protein